MAMQRTAAALVASLGLAAVCAAQPTVNGATLHTRVFNDFPSSTLVTVNTYPGVIQISDGNMVGTGFANLHNWHVSSDGGASDAVFNNGGRFSLFSDVTLSGAGGGELGLQLTPWFSQNVDGRFNVRGSDGEVAIFGGRLPFYSFTASQAVHYVVGTTVRLGIEYDSHSLTAADPGQIRYSYSSVATGALTSGWIPFDQGNPAEDPPHGLWGILNDARLGGFIQVFGAQTGAATTVGTWGNIVYTPAPGSIGILALGGLLAARRRRHA